jgi:hypothetical protein
VQTAINMNDELRIPAKSFWHKLPIVAFVLGLTCLALWASNFQAEPDRAMYGYLFAFVSVLGVALGCMVFVIIQHLTRAGWSVAVRRVAEFGMASIPLFALLFIPIALLAHDLFPWSHIEPGDVTLENKAPYLNMSFFMVRSVIYFVVWLVIGLWFYRSSLAQDVGNRFEDTRKMWAASAPAIMFFALSVSFASFDWVMSLQPHWYSTIFGVYFFAGCFLSGMAFMTLVLLGLQNAGALKSSVTAEHYHDLGKLMFGFTVFWTYVSFSQFMLYWYANIPEETEFYMHRLQHGWEYISYALPITNFFLPFFFIMSRHVKRNRLALAAFCCWVLLVHFVDIFWVVMPNYGAHHLAPGMEPPHAGVTLYDFAAAIGMLSLFVGYVSFLVVRKNIVPVGDPRLKESLAFENF